MTATFQITMVCRVGRFADARPHVREAQIAKARFEAEPEFRERRRATKRKFYHVHKEEIAAERKRLRSDPDYREKMAADKRVRLLAAYNLTPASYSAMLARQNGRWLAVSAHVSR